MLYTKAKCHEPNSLGSSRKGELTTAAKHLSIEQVPEREHCVAPGNCVLTLFCSRERHTKEQSYRVPENQKGLP